MPTYDPGEEGTYSWPSGTEFLEVRVEGADGAEAPGTQSKGLGGSGAYVEFKIDVADISGDAVEYRVGESAESNDDVTDGGWPGGGEGGRSDPDDGTDDLSRAGGGGGLSDIRAEGDGFGDVIAVGGGGGGGGEASSAQGPANVTDGADAGYPDGSDADDATIDGSITEGEGGEGGTQSSAGGPAGNEGGQGSGGNGDHDDASQGDAEGGGGGAGWYGGGGGNAGASGSGAAGGGGGGGSSTYIDDCYDVSTGTSGGGGLVEITAVQSPADPNNVEQDVRDDDSVEVTWDGDTSEGPNDEYEVEVEEDGGSWEQVGTPTSESFTHSPDRSVDSLRYRVRSTNDAGDSGWVETSEETTNAKDLSVDAHGETSVDLSWTDPSANDGTDVLIAQSSGSDTASDYDVEESLGSSASSTTVTGLENGERYYFRVQATYTGDDGTPAPVSNEVDQITDLPAPTLDALDAATDREITLSYTLEDNSTDGDVVVERSTDAGDSWSDLDTISDLDATEFTDNELDDGTRYDYRLRRETDHTESTSNDDSAITILPAPTQLIVTDERDESLDIEWSATHNAGETRVDYRESDADDWETFGTVARDTESERIDGLLNGEEYEVRVVAQTDDAETVYTNG